MNKSILVASIVALAAGIIAPAHAATENVLQLKGKLDNPADECKDQRLGAPESGYFNLGYGNNSLFPDLNYTIAVGDFLEYEVFIPKDSTIHGGAVDGILSATPRKAGGATIRDAFVTEDQNGLFAHPSSNFDVLSTRFTQVCGADGKPQTVPLWQPGQWYRRQIDLSKLAIDDAGDPVMINSLFVNVDAHDTTHLNDLCPVDKKNANFMVLYRNINIKNKDAAGKVTLKKAIYNAEAKLRSGDVSIDVTGSKSSGTIGIVQFDVASAPYAPGSAQ